MFGSEVLDVAIGLTFIYLVLSLICSAGGELIESVLKRRAAYLERGLRELFDDRGGTGLVREIYRHPLIASLFRGYYQPGHTGNLPSYIPARNFALALMDIIGPAGPEGQSLSVRSGAAGSTALPCGSPGSPVAPGATAGRYAGTAFTDSYSGVTPQAGMLRDAIMGNLSANPHAAQALLTLAESAGYDAVRVRENIENWYNSSMDRVSGWFRRDAQRLILALGLLLSVAINADTLEIVNSLATGKALRDSLVSAAAEAAKRPGAATQAMPQSASAADTSPAVAFPDEITRTIPACQVDLNSPDCRFQSNLRRIRDTGLPLGWAAGTASPTGGQRRVPETVREWISKVIGLCLTALAISTGAAFWFDTLARLMAVRSTMKPKEAPAGASGTGQ